MAIDPRTYDLDELRSASGRLRTTDLGGERGESGRSGESGESGGEESTAEPTDADRQDADANRQATDATERLGGDHERPATATDRPAADAAFERAIARDLAARDAGSGGTERPYLPALPGSIAAEAMLFEWLEYLVLQAGAASASEALDFYESVGWLGGDAAEALEVYLSGIDDPRANEGNALDVDDHRVSLHYVARLASLVE